MSYYSLCRGVRFCLSIAVRICVSSCMIMSFVMVAFGIKYKVTITSSSPLVILFEILSTINISEIGSQRIAAESYY